MKYANQISEILNAFTPEPLTEGQMDEFYCEKTMEYRMSDKYSSPIEDIYDICQESGTHNAFLLLGHKGCGKSTELNRMSSRFASQGYPVKTIICSMDLDLLNIVYSDLLILMGEALLEIAKEFNCDIDEETLSRIAHFWISGTEITATKEEQGASLDAGVSAETPGVLAGILSAFVKVKANLKYNEEKRIEYRTEISNHSSEWIELLSYIADEISKMTSGKRPIIIFEDLDKLNPEDAWKVFYNYSAILSGMPFPVIYTFPIGLSYDGRFAAIEGYFISKTLPMIKIETIDGQPFEDGIEVIREIIRKRADLNLFEQDVLDILIQFTGGTLRDLFYVINTSAKRAVRRKSDRICMEDAERALEELRTSLTKRIEQKDYAFLSSICEGNKERIEDREMLLKMLQASVVLEYNGRRWHNVHPLVVQFLEEQGLMGDAEV